MATGFEELHLLAKYSHDAVLVLSEEQEILEINPTTLHVLDLLRPDCLHKNLKTVCKENQIRFTVSADLFKIETNETLHNILISIKKKNTKQAVKISWTIIKLKTSIYKTNAILMIGVPADAPPAFKPKHWSASQISNKDKEIHLLKTIIAKIPGHLYWKDKNGVYLGSNDGNIRSAGLASLDDILARTDAEMPWKKENKEIRRMDQEVMRSGKPLTLEESGTLSDGTKMVVLSQKTPLRDEKGKIIGIIGNSIDITDLKNTQKALQEAKEKAEIANQEKSNFLAVMSHEFRTPLNAILGITQIMLTKLQEPKDRENINIIFQAGKHLLTLISDILDFSKIESGKFNLKYESFNLNEMISYIIATTKHLVNDKEIKLSSFYDQRLPENIVADPNRVKQIIMNLAGNAIKFTKKGSIKISAKLYKNFVKITVADTGIGIPQNQLDKIFERFTQVDVKYNRKYEGAGLGLAICKQLAEAMQGRIGVTSRIKNGSKFWFTIPLHSGAQAPVSTSTTYTPISASKKREWPTSCSILLIEDNLLNQKVAKAMLSSFGCDIDVVSNGKEAIKASRKNRYNLIITDIGLPDISGIDIIKTIRADEGKKQHTRIIALTAHALDEDRTNCLEAGADDVLVKPIMMDELTAMMKKWIQNK